MAPIALPVAGDPTIGFQEKGLGEPSRQVFVAGILEASCLSLDLRKLKQAKVFMPWNEEGLGTSETRELFKPGAQIDSDQEET